jgi:general secretion pathway protein B
MSMILDALTRAEHERQIEKQPDLKFVSSVIPRQKKSNNIWLWVILGLLANAAVLAILLRSDTGTNEVTEVAKIDRTVNPNALAAAQTPVQTQVTEEVVAPAVEPISAIEGVATTNPSTVDRSLAVELGNKIIPELDRPLLYEAKQAKTSPQSKIFAKAKTPIARGSTATSPAKGVVSFSKTELEFDEASQSITNAPKLLIDQGETNPSAAYVPSLEDLPDGLRSNLSQYEINVHVFDDDPQRRFVLINMNKYKEADHIANNGPLVEEITREGVIVDYGNGRALLPSK